MRFIQMRNLSQLGLYEHNENFVGTAIIYFFCNFYLPKTEM